jgi:hypothetical protein
MAYEYSVNLKLDSSDAQKSIDKVLKQLKKVQETASGIKIDVDAKNVGKKTYANRTAAPLLADNILGDRHQADKTLKNASLVFSKTGSFLSKVSEIGRDVSIGMRNFQSTVSGIMGGMLGTVESVGNRFLSLAEDYFSQALDQYQTMEKSQIGFGNLFTDAQAKEISDTIVKTANKMAGVSVDTLLGGVNVLAPYTGGNSKLAIGAAAGLMKAITYSGQDVSQVGTKALTNLGQLASGQFRGITDIRELYRQVPAIDKLLQSTTRGAELLDKNGKLSTDKMRSFIKKYGSQAMLEVFQEIGESSAASDIYTKYGKTFSGSMQNLKDNIVSGMMTAFDDSGLAKTMSSEFIAALDKGGFVENLKNKLGSIMAGINDFINKNMDKLKEIGRGALTFFKDTADAIGEAVVDLLKYLGVLDEDGKINLEGIKKLAHEASRLTKGMIEGFKDGLKGLGDTIRWISEHLGEDGWEALGKAIGWILSPIGKLTTGLISLGAGIAKFLATVSLATGSSLKDGLLFKTFSGGSAITAARNAYDSKVVMGQATSFGTKLKAATSAVGAFATKTLGAVTVGGAIWSLTQVVGNVIKALKLFGNKSEDVAGVIKTVGTELAFVISGAIIGGITGGVIGAILGLGVAAADAIHKINEKMNENTKAMMTFLENERDQNAYYLVMKMLKEAGVNTDTESEEGSYANERLKKKIKGSNGNFNYQELVNEFANALNYKKSAEGIVSLTGTDAFKNAGGKTIDFDVDTEKRSKIAEMVKWYRLLGDDYGYNTNQERIVKDYLSSGGYSTMTEEQYNMLMNGKTDVENAMSKQTTKLVENTTVLDENAEQIRQQTIQSKFLTDAISNLNSTMGDFPGIFFGNNVEKKLNWGANFEGKDVSYEDLDAIYEQKINEMSEQLKNETDETKKQKLREELAEIMIDAHRYNNKSDGTHTIAAQELAQSLAYYDWFAEALKKRLGLSKAMGGFITPIYRAAGGTARGIDTVPAMLSPGEYVVKSSAVTKAGLGVLDALNHGDLGFAARSLGAKFSNSWNNSRSYASTVNNNQKTVTNNVTVNNRTRGGALNSYWSLANRMAASF